jgi:hypothetical protein
MTAHLKSPTSLERRRTMTDTSNYRIVKDRHGREQHQSEVVEPTYFVGGGYRGDRDEWGVGPNQLAGPNAAMIDRTTGKARSAQDQLNRYRGTPSADPMTGLAFSNQPIPSEHLIDMTADDELGPIVAERMRIDLANQLADEPEPPTQGGWRQKLNDSLEGHPCIVRRPVDLSIQRAIAEQASHEEILDLAIKAEANLGDLLDDPAFVDWLNQYAEPESIVDGRLGLV